MRQLRAPRAAARWLAVAGLLAACAQQGAPPGGPPDPAPPVLLRVTPDSGAVNARPTEVLFRFDEVVAERPARVPSLDQLFLVSPRDGAPQVQWRRTALGVRPRDGWRPNTTYVVEMLAGVVDLRGNVLDSGRVVVFSTGPTIPATRITGVVFDWPRGEVARGALVQAVVRPDTAARDSVVYVTRADSSGRFELPFVPAGAVTVRGGVDANRNVGLEPRELSDVVQLTLTDSARVELYAFVRDTTGPRISEVAVADSVTLRVTLTQPLALDQALDGSLVELYVADSAAVPLAAVLTRRAADSLAAAADSAARADSAAVDSAAVDSVATPPAPPDSAAAPPAAPDSAPATPPGRPVLGRPVPTSEIVVRTAAPLAPQTRYRLVVTGARNLLGAAATSERIFTTPAPPAPPPTPPPAAPPPPPPDSAGPPRRG